MSWNKENVNLSLELASVYYHCQTPLTLSVKFLPVFGHLTLLKYSNNSLLLFFVFVHYYLHLNLVDGCCVIVIGIIGWCCGGCRCCCCRWQWLGNATAVILASRLLSWLLISAHCNKWDDAVDKLQRRVDILAAAHDVQPEINGLIWTRVPGERITLQPQQRSGRRALTTSRQWQWRHQCNHHPQ